jgi:hypothetical protein
MLNTGHIRTHGVIASGSDGLHINSYNGAEVALFGAGSSQASIFNDGVTITGLTTYNGGLIGANATSTGTFYSNRTYLASTTAGLLTVGTLTSTTTATTTFAGGLSAVVLSTSGGFTSSGTATSSFAGGIAMKSSLIYDTDNINGIAPIFTLQTNGGWSGAEPVLRFHNSAGGVTTAQLGSFPGSSYTNAAFRISVANSSKVLTERMRIDVNGYVGIGTSTPVTNLTVSGETRSNKFTATDSTATSTFKTLSVLGNIIQVGQSVTLMASSTSNVSGLYTIDWDNGNNQQIILSGNASININATSSKPYVGGFYFLTVCQDGTGGRTVTWSANYPKWQGVGNATTTIPTGANMCIDTIWHFMGSTMLQYYSVASSTSSYSRL